MGITAAAAAVAAAAAAAVKATVDIMATMATMDISTAMRCQLQLLPQPLPQLQPPQQLQAEECSLLQMFKLVSSS